MFARAILVAATAAVLLPLAAGPAHASCLDDAQTGLSEGYSPSPKSEYWSLGGRYIQWNGSLTATVQGDALVSDYTSVVTDQVRFVQVVSGNAPDTTTDFADCVAG